MELRAPVLEVLVAMGKPAPSDPASSLVEAGILDSLTILELVNALEDRFDITFEEEDLTLENFQTLETIERVVRARLPPAQ